MENIKKFLKAQAWLIIVSLIIGGVFLYVFLPKFREYQKIEKDIEVQEQKIVVLTRKFNDLNTLSEKELQDNVDLSLRAVPAEKDFYVVVKNIKNIFGQEGVLLPEFEFSVGEISTQSAKTTEQTEKSQPEFFGIELSFFGPMDKVEKVISRLENSLPLLSVNSLKLNSDSSSPNGQLGNYEGTMNLKSYFALLPRTLGVIDEELPKINSQQKKQLEDLSSFEYYTAEEVPLEETAVGRENPFLVY